MCQEREGAGGALGGPSQSQELVMFAVLLAFGMTADIEYQQAGAVTDAEKKEFIKLLMALPTEGEFFTSEAVAKAVPYTHVLLALTEKDIKEYDLYSFLTLSRGLLDRKDQQ